MFRVVANHKDASLAADDLALLAHFFCGGTDFHPVYQLSESRNAGQKVLLNSNNNKLISILAYALNSKKN